MFSKACEYAIRSVIYIVAKSKNEERVGIKEISKEAGAPEPFTAKILQKLAKANIISSVKGPSGGFYIDKKAKQIMLVDIVTAIDGTELFTGCGLGLKYCSEKRPCPIHHQFKSIRDDIQHLLETTSIHALTEDLEKGLAFLRK